MDVFLVEHTYILDEMEETKLIGIYSDREKAEQAVTRLRVQPGFSDFPEAFTIDRYTLDQDHWTEGFITIRYPEQE